MPGHLGRVALFSCCWFLDAQHLTASARASRLIMNRLIHISVHSCSAAAAGPSAINGKTIMAEAASTKSTISALPAHDRDKRRARTALFRLPLAVRSGLVFNDANHASVGATFPNQSDLLRWTPDGGGSRVTGSRRIRLWPIPVTGQGRLGFCEHGTPPPSLRTERPRRVDHRAGSRVSRCGAAAIRRNDVGGESRDGTGLVSPIPTYGILSDYVGL